MLPRQVQFQTKGKWDAFQVSLSYFLYRPDLAFSVAQPAQGERRYTAKRTRNLPAPRIVLREFKTSKMPPSTPP
jgi:hypothetical protein